MMLLISSHHKENKDYVAIAIQEIFEAPISICKKKEKKWFHYIF